MDKQLFRELFGSWLKTKRKAANKTLEQVSTLSGVGRGHVSEIERGIIGCTILKGIMLAESVDCKFEEFIKHFEQNRSSVS